ncbi:MAG: mechanosensitive ion channel [Oscillospiraceae bacterium]|nr:mechanosensitive ion channel [Oscillospiraceae bacterium]
MKILTMLTETATEEVTQAVEESGAVDGSVIAEKAENVVEAVSTGNINKDVLADFANAVIGFIPTILVAVVIYIVGRIITSIIVKLIDKAAKKTKVDKTATDFLTSLFNIILTAIVIVISLSVLGVPMTSIITVIGAASVAIGLALQNSLSNVAGGFIILFTKPFEKGHYISCQGVEGTVSRIGIMTTEIKTLDNKVIYIPNGQLSSSTLVNFSKERIRRVDLKFSVDYSTDLKKAQAALKKVIAAHPMVLHNEDEFARVSELADSGVIFTVRAWTNTANYWTVYFDLIEGVKDEFDAQGITIPFPQVMLNKRTDKNTTK